MTAPLLPDLRGEAPALPAARRLFVTLPTQLTLRDGRTVTLRGAHPLDGPEVDAMHGRCSAATTAGRYLTPLPRLPRRLLAELLTTEVALVGVDGIGRVVALGNLASIDGDDRRAVEVCLLVEDAWQDVGLGTALLGTLAGAARLLGYRRLVAVSRGPWVRPAMRRLGPADVGRTPFGDSVVVLALRPHHVSGLASRLHRRPRAAPGVPTADPPSGYPATDPPGLYPLIDTL